MSLKQNPDSEKYRDARLPQIIPIYFDTSVLFKKFKNKKEQRQYGNSSFSEKGFD